MEISGYFVLLAAMIATRIINERGYKLLSDAEKIRLMDGFSKARAYSLIPLFALIGGYFLLMKKTDLDKRILTTGYFGLLMAYVLVRSAMSQRKMVSLDLPAGYRRCFTISQIVSLIGVAWFFFAVFGAKPGTGA